MSEMQRSKGKSGEREAASIVRDITGWDVRRRVRQHDGDSDLVGVPGWSVEIKRHANATPAVLRAWWDQAVAQAGDLLPALLYRLDRRDWRAVWPLGASLERTAGNAWLDYTWAVEGSVDAWAAVARECAARSSRERAPSYRTE